MAPLDLNLLVTFEAVASELNITKAARRLNLSQPALSARLARLRRLLGDQLFVPTARGVIPTARALELLVTLRRPLDELRAAIRQSGTFDATTSDLTFRLSASDNVQIAVLLPFLLRLRTIAPRLRILISLGDSRTAAQLLERGDVDLAFVERRMTPQGVRSTTLYHERYVGIINRRSRLVRPIGLETYAAADHVIVSPRAEGFNGPGDAALAAIGRMRHVTLATSSFVLLIEAVAQSDMLALAPARLARQFSDRVDLFEPPVDVEGFEIAMLWHDRTQDHPGHIWFRDRLVRFCRDSDTKLPTTPRSEHAAGSRRGQHRHPSSRIPT